jgi:hypothetical protein
MVAIGGKPENFCSHPELPPLTWSGHLFPLSSRHRYRFASLIVFVTSRAHAIKRSTIGLKVRFFNMTIATGHGRTGRSIGNAFKANWRAFARSAEYGIQGLCGYREKPAQDRAVFNV